MRSPSMRTAYSLGTMRRLRVRHHAAALQLFIDDDAVGGVRLRHGERAQRTLRKRQEVPSGHDPPAMSPPASSRRRVMARRCRSRSCTARDLVRDGSAPLLLYGYGSYGSRDAGLVFRQPAVAGRPRLRLRHRAHPRRRGQGLALVSRRQARDQDQHLRAISSPPAAAPDRARSYTARQTDRRPRRQCRRYADGRGRQPWRPSCSPASSPKCPSSTC